MKNYYADIEKLISNSQDIDLFVVNPGDGTPIVVDYPGGPVDIKDPIEIIPLDDDENLKAYHYSGHVIDQDNGQAIPGATVEIHANNKRIAVQVADGSGFFDLYTSQEGEDIIITSAGYKGKGFGATQIRHEFPMEKNEVELDPVIVTATKKKNWIWLVVLGLVVAKEEKWI